MEAKTMKRMMSGLLALGLVMLAANPASAWCNFNFGTGVNLGFSCGGLGGCCFPGFCCPGPCGCGYPGVPAGPSAEFDGYGVAVGYPVQSPVQAYPGAGITPAQATFEPYAQSQAGNNNVKAPDYWAH
jgi:hypothetical protein